MTRLLWHSNSPWSPTGYGAQTGLFLPHLREFYPELACSAFYGLEGAPLTWDGIPVFPGVGGNYGDEFLVQHAKRFFGGDPKDGLVVTLMDVWVLNPMWLGQVNAACWVPVDHDPAPPAVLSFFEQSGAVPVAMSRFGEERLASLDPLYVPHGVDTAKYRPYDRDAVRREVGVPEDFFLVGMVAANKGRPSRKGFSQAFQAFKRFAEKHDNAALFLHTAVQGAYAQGENIPAMLDALDIPADRVVIADQYRMMFDPYPASVMAKIYSAMDVLLNPSMGEGFGVPVLEAQACGVPAIVTDFSAMAEVCGAGWRAEHVPWWTGQNSWQALPDVDDLTAALEECYALSGSQRDALSKQARDHALGYDVRRVTDKFMLPALAEAQKRLMAPVLGAAA